MGTAEADTPAAGSDGAPFSGVEAREWDKLVEKGRQSGEVHAEDVTHVLRHVELTGDVLTDVQSKMAEHGITIDDAVDTDDVVHDEPAALIHKVTVEPAEPPVPDDSDEKLLSRRRGRRSKKTQPKGEGGTSDAVRMYLREIGAVDLLTT